MHSSLGSRTGIREVSLSSFFAKAGPTVIMLHDETSWSSSEKWFCCSLGFQVVRKGDRNPYLNSLG